MSPVKLSPDQFSFIAELFLKLQDDPRLYLALKEFFFVAPVAYQWQSYDSLPDYIRQRTSAPHKWVRVTPAPHGTTVASQKAFAAFVHHEHLPPQAPSFEGMDVDPEEEREAFEQHQEAWKEWKATPFTWKVKSNTYHGADVFASPTVLCTGRSATLEEAQRAADDELRARGWTLDEHDLVLLAQAATEEEKEPNP